MRQLKEALIGRHNAKNALSNKELKKFSELKFGDIIQIYENGSINIDDKEGVNIYMYLPKDIGKNIIRNEGSFDDVIDDILIIWVPKRVHKDNIVYWNATDFKVYFPFHQIYQSNCKIEQIIGHYDNYKSIKNANELKAVLKKYNN